MLASSVSGAQSIYDVDYESRMKAINIEIVKSSLGAFESFVMVAGLAYARVTLALSQSETQTALTRCDAGNTHYETAQRFSTIEIFEDLPEAFRTQSMAKLAELNGRLQRLHIPEICKKK